MALCTSLMQIRDLPTDLYFRMDFRRKMNVSCSNARSSILYSKSTCFLASCLDITVACLLKKLTMQGVSAIVS